MADDLNTAARRGGRATGAVTEAPARRAGITRAPSRPEVRSHSEGAESAARSEPPGLSKRSREGR
eukprot:2736866-Prymnesium_polylepis.1